MIVVIKLVVFAEKIFAVNLLNNSLLQYRA